MSALNQGFLTESLNAVTDRVNTDLNEGEDFNATLANVTTYMVYLQKVVQDLIQEGNDRSKPRRRATGVFVDAQSSAIAKANNFDWRIKGEPLEAKPAA